MFFQDWEILIYVFLTRFYQESGVAAMNQNISNFYCAVLPDGAWRFSGPVFIHFLPVRRLLQERLLF